jgi:hypothetical protein
VTKLRGKDVEVRIATTENGLDSAEALTNVESIEWNPDQNVDRAPAGLGSRLKEVSEGLIDYTGSMSRWHDKTAVAGSTDFATAVGAYQQGALTPLYVEVYNKVTGEKVRLKKCKGTYSRPVDSPEGYVMEAWDFSFEDISMS